MKINKVELRSQLKEKFFHFIYYLKEIESEKIDFEFSEFLFAI